MYAASLRSYRQKISEKFQDKMDKRDSMYPSKEERIYWRGIFKQKNDNRKINGMPRIGLQWLKVGHSCSGRCRHCARGPNLYKSMLKQKGYKKKRRIAMQLASDD